MNVNTVSMNSAVDVRCTILLKNFDKFMTEQKWQEGSAHWWAWIIIIAMALAVINLVTLSTLRSETESPSKL